MPRNLICPKCGKYQNNDKIKRKVKTGLKNVGKFAIRESAKEGVGFIADSVTPGAGRLVKNFFSQEMNVLLDEVGLKTQSLNSVKYICHNCGCQWDGYDRPDIFNDVQKATVLSMKKKEMSDKHADFSVWLMLTFTNLIFAGICFWMYSYRHIDIETTSNWLFGEIQTQTYSWHYYVFWPMIIIIGSLFLGFLCKSMSYFEKYLAVKNCNLEDYAKKIGL